MQALGSIRLGLPPEGKFHAAYWKGRYDESTTYAKVTCYDGTVLERPDVTPTARDLKNERVRTEIAARMEEQYMECLQWTTEVFGPGWKPSGRHFLVDRVEEDRCRKTGERPQAAATVYIAKKGGEKRCFMVDEGTPREVENCDAGFGTMLLESHPTQTIEVRGQRVHPHRYSLCFAPYELYRPKSAQELAALRVRREQKKAEKEQREWAERNPLFAQHDGSQANSENGHIL